MAVELFLQQCHQRVKIAFSQLIDPTVPALSLTKSTGSAKLKAAIKRNGSWPLCVGSIPAFMNILFPSKQKVYVSEKVIVHSLSAERWP
jgi:hypothetical protein